MLKRELAAAAALATLAAMAWPAPSAQAQSVCSAEKSKKRGLGRLMTGLKGSIGGALRGDGDLGSDLAGTAQASARVAAECVPPDASEASREATTREKRRKAAVPAPGSERPAPRDAKAEAIAYPSRIPIPEEWKAAKQAYDEFGKARCSDCEGGYAYSGWPSWPSDDLDGKYNANEKRMSRLSIGQVHRWSANGFAGTLTVDGDEEHHGFQCRRLTYRLEKEGRSADRPGLLCLGRQNQYAGSESWVGVF